MSEAHHPAAPSAPHRSAAPTTGDSHVTVPGVGSGGDVWARVVHHPGTKPNRWEERVRAELEPVLVEEGNKIGVRVAQELSGKR